jgi:hypothetical protein
MQEDKFRNDVLIKSIGQFLQNVLPTTPTPVPAQEVEAVPPTKIEVKEEVPEYCFGPRATSYLALYAYNSDSLDRQYGIRKDGDKYRIGNSTDTIDGDRNIYHNVKRFKGTEGLWEILTRKKPNLAAVTTKEFRKYKSILQMTNAHFEHYEPGSYIHVSRGVKYRDVIAKLFTQRGQKNRGLRIKYGGPCPLVLYAWPADGLSNRR